MMKSWPMFSALLGSSSQFSSSPIPTEGRERTNGTPEMERRTDDFQRNSGRHRLRNPRTRRRLVFEEDQHSNDQIRPRDDDFRDITSVLRGVLAVKQEKERSKNRLHSTDEIPSGGPIFQLGKGFNQEIQVTRAKRRLNLGYGGGSLQSFHKCGRLSDDGECPQRFSTSEKVLSEEHGNGSTNRNFNKCGEVLDEVHGTEPNGGNCIRVLGEEDVNISRMECSSSSERLEVESHANPPNLSRGCPVNGNKGPYPDFGRPSSEECREVRDRLLELHGILEEFARYRPRSTENVVSAKRQRLLSLDQKNGAESVKDGRLNEKGSCFEKNGSEGIPMIMPSEEQKSMLDSLISTLLSQNTTEANSRRAFASLKAAFPSWDDVHKADLKAVEDAIRCGGLAETKASRIRNILDTLLKEQGKICLEHLRNMPVDKIKSELCRFKGVGPKTVACVLMFHLHQDDFPVDTHVFRVTKALGWVPAEADRVKAYLHLNHRIPNDLKFDLNCLLVTHGKCCPNCAKGGRLQRAPDGPCPLVNRDCKPLVRPRLNAWPNKLLNCR